MENYSSVEENEYENIDEEIIAAKKEMRKNLKKKYNSKNRSFIKNQLYYNIQKRCNICCCDTYLDVPVPIRILLKNKIKNKLSESRNYAKSAFSRTFLSIISIFSKKEEEKNIEISTDDLAIMNSLENMEDEETYIEDEIISKKITSKLIDPIKENIKKGGGKDEKDNNLDTKEMVSEVIEKVEASDLNNNDNKINRCFFNIDYKENIKFNSKHALVNIVYLISLIESCLQNGNSFCLNCRGREKNLTALLSQVVKINPESLIELENEIKEILENSLNLESNFISFKNLLIKTGELVSFSYLFSKQNNFIKGTNLITLGGLMYLDKKIIYNHKLENSKKDLVRIFDKNIKFVMFILKDLHVTLEESNIKYTSISCNNAMKCLNKMYKFTRNKK